MKRLILLLPCLLLSSCKDLTPEERAFLLRRADSLLDKGEAKLFAAKEAKAKKVEAAK